jgi:hypothetical protein
MADNVWDQSGFRRFEAGLDRERQRLDKGYLSVVFSAAADSPLLADALEWGDKHGIRYFVDHQTQKLGYYTPDSGVVAVARQGNAGSLRESIDTLAHELRHAWQDYHGLLASSHKPFLEHVLNISLTEADATAFGKVARRQYEERTLQPAERALWIRFQNWFYTDNAQSYGEDAMYDRAERLQFKVMPSETVYEFNEAASSRRPPLNISLEQEIDILGRDFTGRKFNYIAAHKSAPAFIQKITDPQRVARFYDKTRKYPDKMVRRICKKEGLRL